MKFLSIFRRLQKEEKEKKEEVDLYEICKKFGKEYLYDSISRLFPSDPSKLKSIVGKSDDPILNATINIYEGKYELAKKILEESRDYYSQFPYYSHRVEYIKIIVNNFDYAVKILKEYWKSLKKENK
jgi:predicted transcriptional regulator with HTH domain